MTRSLDEVAGALDVYVEMVGVVIGYRHLDETPIQRERRQSWRPADRAWS
jgi:hypothetical protein